LFRKLRGPAPEPALDAALVSLTTSGRVVRTGRLLRLKEHEARLGRETNACGKSCSHFLLPMIWKPPRVRELAAGGAELQPFERFLNASNASAAWPRRANRVFLPETVVRHRRIARELAEASSEAQFHRRRLQDRSGIGRKPDDRGARIPRPASAPPAGRQRPHRRPRRPTHYRIDQLNPRPGGS